MSLSMYYTARRNRPLTEGEREAIGRIATQYSKSSAADRHATTGKGMNWEDFHVFELDPQEPDVVFSGANKLPDNTAFALYHGARHWAACLGDIRREALPDASWVVQIDDKTLQWSEDHGWHDNASDGFASLWLGCALSAPFRLFSRR